MARYIELGTIVAEIERRHNQEVQWMERQGYTGYHQGLRDGYANILSFLNTLDTKEVDIEDAVHGTVDFPLPGYDFPNIYPNYKELKDYCDKNDIKDKDKVKLIIIKEE